MNANLFRCVSHAAMFLSVVAFATGQRSAARAAEAIVPGDPPSEISLRFKPVGDAGGQPLRLEVGLRFGGSPVSANETLVQLPLVSGNLVTAANDVTQLTARDDIGLIPLTTREAGAGSAGLRQWVATRAVHGTVALSYQIPAQGRTGEQGPGTPVELRADGGAISGAASAFLLLPPGEGRYRLSLDWDLSSLAPGSRALSSFGPGDLTAVKDVPLAALRDAYFMAGPIGMQPIPPNPSGFNAAWQGKTPFAAGPLAQWAGTLYEKYSRLLQRPVNEPYSVFIRFNPLNAGGGVGQFRSFVLTYKDEWPANDESWLKFLLAHEMYHTFQPDIAATPGTMDASWFAEGTAVFYGWTLPYRFDLAGPDYVLTQVNMAAMRYYTSAKSDLTNEEVSKGFWADTRVRMLAYDRSAFYFARVDRQIRDASGGKRSLDDLMLLLNQRTDAGKKLTPADWEEVIVSELGPSAATDFRDMLAGKLQLPDSDIFGPCLRRTTALLRRYELGFDPNVLIEPDRVVRGVIAGSEAEKAGLRNGDILVVPVPQDVAASRSDFQITLSLRRADREFRITYLPRGEAVATPQWERVPGIPDSECRP